MKYTLLTILGLVLLTTNGVSQIDVKNKDITSLKFKFNGNTISQNIEFKGKDYSFVEGVDGQALKINFDNNLELNEVILDGSEDFSIQYWIKTTSENPMVILSQKDFNNKGIDAQKNSGWVLYCSGGTFAWNVGSGTRRLNYERDNGEKMPINNGKWHMISMTFSKELSEFRLYYDGYNKAIYKVGFDFTNNLPLIIGSIKNDFDYNNKLLPEIELGAKHLQNLIDEFNSLNVESIQDSEFISVIVDPEALFEKKFNKLDTNELELIAEIKTKNLDKVNEIRKKLLSSPYTIHQNKNFSEIKPINKIYSLNNGKVILDPLVAKSYTINEKLYPSDFALDNLVIQKKILSVEQILDEYSKYRIPDTIKFEENINSLTVGVWNIWHGGKHFTTEEHAWDSRLRIVEILKEKNVDIILMQETYSSGDFIAAELGFYFATTSDWDYRMQGSNISVISRYPIKDLEVLQETSFMNISSKLVLSETQEIYAMSNWYGMTSFPLVYDFHENKFMKSDSIPVLFGGDFNAIPHTDGGESPASIKLLNNGFIDAYRSLYPNVKEHPAFTHSSGERIDQLYFKGKGLKNKSTEVISKWTGGFPSDHYMILSKFELNY
jgi:exonuclease III